MFSHRYKKMCKAEEIQDSAKWKKDDYIYHRDGKVIRKLIKFDEDSVTTIDRRYECSISEFIWVPTEEQLKEMAESINLNSTSLENFLNDDKGIFVYPKGIRLGIFFTTPEEQWLAHYMRERYNKIWLRQKEEWREIPVID